MRPVDSPKAGINLSLPNALLTSGRYLLKSQNITYLGLLSCLRMSGSDFRNPSYSVFNLFILSWLKVTVEYVDTGVTHDSLGPAYVGPE